MRKVDSFGMIDCQLVKHDEAQKVLKECITSVKADLTSARRILSFLMLPVYAPISAASRSGTRRRGGDVVRSTSKVSVLTTRKRSAPPTGRLAWIGGKKKLSIPGARISILT